MSLIVQKFGGTSVADPEKIRAAARRAIRAQKQGHRVVMVVSAMGKQTDELLRLAFAVSEKLPAREMDMLLSTGEQTSVALVAMAIDDLGAILVDEYRRQLQASGFSAVGVIDTGSDLNAYAKAEAGPTCGAAAAPSSNVELF